MINQEIQASQGLRTHFEKLLLLKKKVGFYKEEADDRLLDEIYDELDKIIKEAI